MCWVLCSTGARDAKKTCREASDLSIITRQSDGTVRDPPCAPSCLWQLTACCVSSPHAILETTTRGQACGRLLLPSPPPHPQKGYSPQLTGSSGAWNYCNQDQLHNLWQGPLPNKNADPLVQNNIKNFRTATAEHSIYCGAQKGSVAHVAHP